jgi:hypothetical protein
MQGNNYNLEMFAILLRLRQVSVNPQIYIKARKNEAFGWSGPEFHEVSRKFDEVAFLMKDAHEAGEAHKWIVFCQFHEEMVLMDAFLKAHPFVGQVLQYHGGMSMKEREATLKESRSAPQETGSKQDVFLIQLKLQLMLLKMLHRLLLLSSQLKFLLPKYLKKNQPSNKWIQIMSQCNNNIISNT